MSLRIIPGFTAEASFYRSGTQYQASTMLPGLRPGRVVPARKKDEDACGSARGKFRAYMGEIRFWIRQADKLADMGETALAQAAMNESTYYRDLADGALGEMSDAC